MAERLKTEKADLHLIKEFVPENPHDVRSAGRLIVRASNYGSPLDRFDAFYAAMAADAAQFEPPLTTLKRSDTVIVKYGGQTYRGTFGLEATIPEGHIVPEEYTRQAAAEYVQ